MKAWLFTLLISGLSIIGLNAQDSNFSYPKGWYTSIGCGLTIPSIGQNGEGPLGNGYLIGASLTLPTIDYHFHPKWNLAFKFGGNSYRYDVRNFESYVNDEGYKVGNQDLNGAVRHFYFQTGLYRTLFQKGINHFEAAALLGYGFVSMKNVSYLGLREKEGIFVGEGPFYEIMKIDYIKRGRVFGKYHYGLSLRYRQMYKSNDGFFVDIQLLRFETHLVSKTGGGIVRQGSVLLISPTIGFVFSI
ncbi:MAG: hypothetical protein ACPGLV_07400 [Bacteroidia bacterium]